MNTYSEDEFPPKRDLSFRIFLMIDFQMIIVLLYALSPNLTIFWSLFALLFVNLEVISWKILNNPDLTNNGRKFWHDIQETPFLPFIAVILVCMVIIQFGTKIIKDYQIQKEDQIRNEVDGKGPHLTLRVLKKIGFLALVVIFLVILVIFYYLIFSTIFGFLIKVSGYSVSAKIGILIKMISFVLLELSLFGTYRTFDNWIRKPYVPDNGKTEQTPT